MKGGNTATFSLLNVLEVLFSPCCGFGKANLPVLAVTSCVLMENLLVGGIFKKNRIVL